jgi:hypothetical protein
MRHNPYHAIHRNPYHYASPSAPNQLQEQAAASVPMIPETAPSGQRQKKEGKGLYALVPLAAAGIMYIRSESLLKAFGVTFISPMYLAYIGLKKLSGKKVLEKQK